MKFAVLGRTHWLLDSATRLIEDGHELVAVGTCPAAPEYLATESDFERLATEHNVPFFSDSRINSRRNVDLLRESGAQIAISINWLTIIGKGVLELFPSGVVNFHAGDLPRYRGNAAPNWAILNGETQIGLTLHQMVPELDAGPIMLKEHLAISDETYIQDVYAEIERRVPKMWSGFLTQLEAGKVKPQEQPIDPALSLRVYPRQPGDGLINWGDSAIAISRLVRASSEPFAGAFSHFRGKKLIVWRARAVESAFPSLGVPGQVIEVNNSRGEVGILCGKGVIIISEMELNGQRGNPTKLLTSTRLRLGIDLQQEVLLLQKELDALLGHRKKSP